MSARQAEGLIIGAGPAPLCLTLADRLVAPSPEHRLLVGFHFGQGSDDPGLPGVVDTGLVPLQGGSLYEGWWYRGEVEHSVQANVRIASCADYAVAIQQQPDAAPERFRAQTHDAYLEMLHAIAGTPHRHIVKIWNYFGEITRGEGDREKYRQFSMGRATAFDKHRLLGEVVPTGTAIGTVDAKQFSIISLCTSHNFRAAENPRQVSAFEYPRQYGPRSPKFSRGGCVFAGDSRLFIVSGTAAIVGHESLHPDDIALQLEETLSNLDLLSDAITALDETAVPLYWQEGAVLRVYLRNPEDLAFVQQKLEQRLGGAAAGVAYLHANICRQELLVEIDGASSQRELAP